MGRLRDAGFKVESHHDLYPENDHKPESSDVDWISEAARRRWIILTNDKAIGRDELELGALMRGNGRGYVKPPKMTPQDFAELIIRTEARLLKHIQKQRKNKAGPYLARIRPDPKDANGSKPGSISKWIDLAAWQERQAKWAKTRK